MNLEPQTLDITGSYADKARDALRTKPEGMTLVEIAAAIGVSQGVTRRALDRLFFLKEITFETVHRPHTPGQMPRRFKLIAPIQ